MLPGERMDVVCAYWREAALGLINPDLAEAMGLQWDTPNTLDKSEGKASTVQLVRLTLEARGILFFESGQVAAGPGVAVKVCK